MKLLNTSVLVALAAAVTVHAAPAQVEETSQNVARLESVLAKRDNMERALAQLNELHDLKRKRLDLDVQLSDREYKIVTEVLQAITDTDIAPRVLHYLVTNNTIKKVVSEATIWVVKSGLISLDTLLELLVQSGLLNKVLTDVLGNCETYVAVVNIAKDVVDKLIGKVKDKIKRDAEPYTDDEAMDLLRRDGMLRPSMLEGFEFNEEKRDLDDVVNNLLDSLGKSGLASQVVQAVLSDKQFLQFGVDLIKELMNQNLIHVSSLIGAVKDSGLIPDVLKLLLNKETLKNIGSKALQAITGKCNGDSGNTGGNDSSPLQPASPVTTPTTTASVGGGGPAPTSTPTTKAQAPKGIKGGIDGAESLVKSVAAASTPASDPCATNAAKRDFKKLRLNY